MFLSKHIQWKIMPRIVTGEQKPGDFKSHFCRSLSQVPRQSHMAIEHHPFCRWFSHEKKHFFRDFHWKGGPFYGLFHVFLWGDGPQNCPNCPFRGWFSGSAAPKDWPMLIHDTIPSRLVVLPMAITRAIHEFFSWSFCSQYGLLGVFCTRCAPFQTHPNDMLVGGLESWNFMTFHSVGKNHPNWLSYFSEGLGWVETTNQIFLNHH